MVEYPVKTRIGWKPEIFILVQRRNKTVAWQPSSIHPEQWYLEVRTYTLSDPSIHILLIFVYTSLFNLLPYISGHTFSSFATSVWPAYSWGQYEDRPRFHLAKYKSAIVFLNTDLTNISPVSAFCFRLWHMPGCKDDRLLSNISIEDVYFTIYLLLQTLPQIQLKTMLTSVVKCNYISLPLAAILNSCLIN